MHVQAITLFPEMFAAITKYGVTSKALKSGLWHFDAINLRQFADNPLGYIDDRPYGGGPGMVMQVEPLLKAYEFALAQAKSANPCLIYLSPQGETINHDKVLQLSQLNDLILVCGRYEGIDERFLKITNALEVSVADIVVSGGELPAMLLMDSILRCVPGVLGDEDSAMQDSFAQGLLDCPHYTRPVNYAGHEVPAVLLSGHHEKVRRWRIKQSLARTYYRRPDLLDDYQLNPEESCLLDEVLQERQE